MRAVRNYTVSLAFLAASLAFVLSSGCVTEGYVGPGVIHPDGGLPSCVANNYTSGSVYAPTALVPDDGDKVCASRSNPGDGPVNPGIKQALDNSGWAHALLYGNYDLPPSYSVDGANVVMRWIPPIGFATASTPTTPYWGQAKSSATVDVPTAFGSPLAADTWYYIYMKSNGSFIVLTTGPDISGKYQSGNETRALVAFCRTDGAGVVIPFSSASGRYSYAAPRAWNVGGSNSLRLATFSAVGNSTLAFTTYVPPFAKSARVAYFLTGNLNGGAILQGITAAGWTSGADVPDLWYTAGNLGTNYYEGDFNAPLPLGDATQVKFYISAHVSGSLTFGVSEFTY